MKTRRLAAAFAFVLPSARERRRALEALGGVDQRAENPRLPCRMPGVRHDPELGLGPGSMQLVRGYERANHVVASLHDHSRDLAEPVRVLEQGASLEKNLVHEIMRFDPRTTQGNDVPCKTRHAPGT